jgi:hypothetical protein
MGVFMMSLLLPCGGGLGGELGELGEADRPGAGYDEDVAGSAEDENTALAASL